MTLGKALPEKYNSQLNAKIKQLQLQFNGFNLPNLKVYASPDKHFRMRAEFKIWQENNVASYAMFEPGQYKQAILIDEFSIGSELIVMTMPKLLHEINQHAALRNKLFQVEFLSSLHGELLVTLIYHKTLNDEWETLAKKLEAKLCCFIIGRSRKQKIIVSQDYIHEHFSVDGINYVYQQVETGFTQPNAVVCEGMLNWATETSKQLGGDLLELYCGNANFTLPLSRNFQKVLATEVSKTSVKSALENIQANGITNIEVIRLSSEEFTQAMNGDRAFRRLAHLNLEDYQFSTIFVDPPRAGLDEGTLALASRFKNIIYVSCNPDTLKSNLQTLTQTHRITEFAVFDQFPYTDHIESGVCLTTL